MFAPVGGWLDLRRGRPGVVQTLTTSVTPPMWSQCHAVDTLGRTGPLQDVIDARWNHTWVVFEFVNVCTTSRRG